MKKLLSAQQVEAAIDRLCKAVLKDIPPGISLGIVGIRTRGEVLARRIRECLHEAGREAAFGVLDITFYRDDLSRRRGAPLVRATEIDFDLDDTWILLVDDVMQTGRSVRAALDALHDFGRPRSIRLAVLIDRGGRELPIAADFVGAKLKPQPDQIIQVKLEETDGEEGVFSVPRPQ